MRLSRLDLTRYGRFTDFVLDFGGRQSGQPDFHIVYGPNEAGKSTAFSAFLDLLFGIETRSRYNFIHPYNVMQIGGRLEWDGSAHDVVRVKRNAASLLGPGGQPIAENTIAGVLGGIGRDSYRTMFSLDDDTLEAGGENILESRGDLGQLLFSASAGLSDLGQTLTAIQAEADRFYKFRSRSSDLSTMKARLAELKESREAVDTLATHYGQLVAERDASDARFTEASSMRSATRNRIDEIRRLLDALPRRARLEETDAAFARLADLPEPPPVWAEELPGLMRDEVELKVLRETGGATLDRIQAELDALVPDGTALDRIDEFKRLGEQAPRFVTAAEDLPARRQAMDGVRQAIDAELASLGRQGEAEPRTLLLPASVIGRLRGLIEEGSLIALKVEAARDEQAAAQERLRAADEALAAVIGAEGTTFDLPALAQALAAWRGGDHGSRQRAAARATEAAAEDLAGRLQRLLPWRGEAEELAALVLPPPSRVADWKVRLRELEAGLVRREAEVERLQTEHQRLAAERAAEKASGVVDDAQAMAARAKREEAWVEHRRLLNDATAGAFERAFRHDDSISAARLNQSTQTAQAQATARALAAAEAELARARELAKKAGEQLGSLRDEIAQAFHVALSSLPDDWGIEECETWLGWREHALESWNGVRAARREQRAAMEDAALSAGTLRQMLGRDTDDSAGGETLSSEAEKRIAQEAEAKSLRDSVASLRRQAEKRQADARAASAEHADWARRWSAQLGATWLGPDVLPAQVREMLDGVQRLATLIRDADSLFDRIRKMEADQTAFAQSVAKLAAALEIEVADGDPMPAYEAIGARVRAAETAAEARMRKELERKRAADESRRLGERVSVHEHRAGEMRHFFGVASLAEVALKLRAVEQRTGLNAERDRLEREIAEGLGLPDMAAADAVLKGVEALPLRNELGEAEARFEAEDARVRELYAAHARAVDRIEAVGGDDAVARVEESRRTVLLEIEDGALNYLRLKVGIAAADQALRLYRDQHRSSMMERASEAFRTISRGAYARLGTQPEKDAEILIGIAADGSSKLAADMSKGTRFQLYLALRVAGYFEFAAAREPVPFIADDIMETFDDFRAEEAFRLFAGMAEVGQVIYLTHHRHLCDIARAVCPSVSVHELPAAS